MVVIDDQLLGSLLAYRAPATLVDSHPFYIRGRQAIPSEPVAALSSILAVLLSADLTLVPTTRPDPDRSFRATHRAVAHGTLQVWTCDSMQRGLRFDGGQVTPSAGP